MILVKINRQKPKGFENVTEVIQLRQPTTKDLYGLNFSDPLKHTEAYAILISRLSCLTIKEVDELDAKEFLKLLTKITGFIT